MGGIGDQFRNLLIDRRLAGTQSLRFGGISIGSGGDDDGERNGVRLVNGGVMMIAEGAAHDWCKAG